MEPHFSRLSFVFAREAPVAVIFNRSRSKWVQVVRWNTRTDEFDYGQWLHGRIYPEKCDLSPDGTFLVYFARKETRIDFSSGHQRTYTAVSKPPYLTALALWHWGGTYGGGGRFNSNSELCLACGEGFDRPHPDHLPLGLSIVHPQLSSCEYGGDRGFKLEESPIPNAEWFGRDQAGSSVYAKEGKLFRFSSNGISTLLADFNNIERTFKDAPDWAKSWQLPSHRNWIGVRKSTRKARKRPSR